MTFDCDIEGQNQVLGPLVRVIEEAADDVGEAFDVRVVPFA